MDLFCFTYQALPGTVMAVPLALFGRPKSRLKECKRQRTVLSILQNARYSTQGRRLF